MQRLQALIVKAVQKGRWGKVTALQHLLTHSFSGKALLIRSLNTRHSIAGRRMAKIAGNLLWHLAQTIHESRCLCH
ncbi:reverse transcriptase N-terminal domain-containing protein [Acidithiobacillus thiooxidans]|uniref:reverse transcriptase N-terminal domain-containing protein n=1 Tax=Acidithiobacillus thiooxidans TaxID=930 RepID=UPI0028601616|nr:reverse transcriptase N-terminal domain-containing protein [Acidithiobacillus thiooxidans]MDR7928837.1 reverse transcriptase N-terminal domain-containing protein [Acidithiobacillus thiooxidans]